MPPGLALLNTYFWPTVQQWQRNALGSWVMSQSLSVPIRTDGVKLDEPNPESLCFQGAVRFGVKSRTRFHPHSTLPAACCVALVYSPLLSGLLWLHFRR